MKRSLTLLLLTILLTSGLNAQSGLPNKTTKSGFYFETLLGPGFLGHKEANGNTLDGLGFGLNFGNKFYFGDDSKSLRLGMDLNWLGFHNFTPSAHGANFMNLTFVNPGLGVAMALGKDIGVDANINVGPNVMFGTGELEEGTAFGLRFGPQIRFHYHILALGFNYRYATAMTEASDIDGYRTNIFGFTLGLKF